ncbi:MAG: hypothetical protein ACP5J4_20370 [Anaerolineae bacterium]
MSDAQFAALLAHLQVIQGCLLVLVADVVRRFVTDVIDAFTGDEGRQVEIWQGR